MNILKRILLNIEYKKVNEELELLECYFENRSEARACLGHEFIEEDDSEYDERYAELCKRMKELKAMENGFKRI